MNRIKELNIINFKAFPLFEKIVLNNNNLLLFGENGSGKSSIYWALYTFLQSCEKDDAEVDKYFKKYNPSDEKTFQSLRNINSNKRSFIRLIFENNSIIQLSSSNGHKTRVPHIIETNLASDFITYKLLYNFYGNTHKSNLDVWSVFLRDVLPFFSYSRKSYSSHYYDFHIKKAKKSNGYYYPRHSHTYRAYQARIKVFNDNFEALLGKINNQANIFLKEYLDINNIEVILQYTRKFAWDVNKSRNFTEPQIKFHVKLIVDGVFKELHRPQSFLNEAILAQLSLAIRMGALFTRLSKSDTKILVLDDLLISLDMDNRNNILDILLQEKTQSGQPNRFKDFQILFFTHDRGLHYFVKEKIKQYNQSNNWVLKEIYTEDYKDISGKSYPKPIIIDDDLNELEKAKKYLKTNQDYVVSALYLRKYLEKILIERLPKEYVYKLNFEPKALHQLWDGFIKYYSLLKPNSITHKIRAIYNQSRLMILNPQVHYNHMSLPVFKREIEEIINLISYIEANCPALKPTILLSTGMYLIFKHPLINYSFEFTLTSDYLIEIVNGMARQVKPLCKIHKWQYDNNDYFDTKTNTVLSLNKINNIISKNDTKFNSIIHNLTKTNLGIDKSMILNNTIILNSIWTLKDVINKAGISI